ncbi:hypothetical protein [Cohnella algarum]|uniref:hypothetical protein n=1 Tax=Cohnella algarum TaxID=2044859 RepID=UPI0019673169|nr:hypothetical protein [Cohnella algarum]MBN2982786.1 hypothetical protein [Cohnella algarum]
MDQSVIQALQFVLQEELRPLKEDVRQIKGDLLPLKEDVQQLKDELLPLKEDVQQLKDELLPLKEGVRQIKMQLDRMESNQNEDIIAVLSHMSGKLTAIQEDMEGLKHDVEYTVKEQAAIRLQIERSKRTITTDPIKPV